MSHSIPLDTFTLAAVADELNRTLDGARVQKVRQTAPAEIVLTLHNAAFGTQFLFVCADPRGFRVHLTQVKREPLSKETGFLQATRKWLDGARFVSANLPFWDRVLTLRFRSPDGDMANLVCELMGRNANIVLTTGAEQAMTVRHVLRPSGEGERDLKHGAAYVDPPGIGERPDPRTIEPDALPEPPTDPDSAARFYSTTFSGVSRFAAGEIVACAAFAGGGYTAAFDTLISAVQERAFDPHQIGDAEGNTIGVWAFVPRSVPAGLRFRRDSISVALDTFYAALAARTGEAGERATLLKTLDTETKYRERELAAARKTLAEAERADDYEQWGNLILASPGAVPEGGASSVTLSDLYAATEGETVTIPLDPNRTARENADALFARARKGRDAAEYADGQAADLADELEQLAALRVRLDAAKSDEELTTLHETLEEIVGAERIGGKPKASGKPATKPFDGHRVRTYDLDGYTFYVGETAHANDHLLTRVAAPTDIWMHVRAGTGAHGVLRTNKEPTRVPEKVIRRAAAIVAAKSQSVKHSGIVAVDITERRYVRKPRGAKPGLAQYERARTMDVTPELP